MTAREPAETARPAGARRRHWTRLGLAAAVAAALAVTVVAVVAGASPYRALGANDPGGVVRLAGPLLRFLVDAAATVCVGGLFFTAFFTREQESGQVSPAGYAALLTAGRAALVWAVAVLLLWPVDAAAGAGLPLHRVLTPQGLSAVTGALEGPKAWLLTLLVAVVVCVGCRTTLRWRTTVLLTGLALFGVLPPLAAGHSASDTGHDLATAAIMIHVPVAVVWLGTLLAVVRARGLGADRTAVLARYRRVSTVCWWLLALSGLVDAAVLAPGTTAFTTGYGLVLGIKVMVVLLVGVLVTRLRRTANLLVTELVALGVAFGLSVGLTALAAPKFIGIPVSGAQTLLGYDLSGPPTWIRLIFDWRIEVLFAPLCVVFAVGYLLAVRRLRERWPVARTMSWLAGCAVLLVATSSGLGKYAPAMFSLQAVAHVLVGMVAPVLFALGAPLTLAGKVLPRASAEALPGPNEWLGAFGQSRVLRVWTHPLVNAVVFVGAPFLLYFTPAFDVTVRFHWAHLAMDVIFLALGYVFAWMIVGPDPLPRPAPGLVRLGLLLAVMPADLVFAGLILASDRIIGDGNAGANLYTALNLPWVSSFAGDQRLGAYLGLAVSEACVLLLLAVLVLRWRPAAGGDEADTYEPILAELRARRSAPGGAEAAQPQTVGHDQQ